MSKQVTITADEAARRLDKTPASVYLYVKQGLLTNVSLVDGEIRLDAGEVNNFKPRKRGRKPGYRKSNAKHPRLQAYYRRKRGKFDESKS